MKDSFVTRSAARATAGNGIHGSHALPKSPVDASTEAGRALLDRANAGVQKSAAARRWCVGDCRVPSVVYLIMIACLIVAGGSLILAHNRLDLHALKEGIEMAERHIAEVRTHHHLDLAGGPNTDQFQYHRFEDATGQLPSKIVPILVPSPPPPDDRAAKLKRLEWNNKIKAEARELSAKATEEMNARILHDPILPAGGPVESITLPDPKGRPIIRGKYHVVVTNDANMYGRWQTLSNYYWYKKVKAADPDGPMGGYTRLMHSSRADDIMHLVPTVVVDHLPVGLDRGYGPMHRPWGFTQWLLKVHIEEEYIFMTEPDHIFLKQPPLFATPTMPAVFPFWYVNCEDQKMRPWCMKPEFNPKQIDPADILRTGNSPVIIYKETLAKIVPIWDKIVRAIHADLEADKALGWAQEMYAFSLAAANVEGGPTRVTYHCEFMVEPPFAPSLTVDTCSSPVKQPNECPTGKSSAATKRDVSIIHFTFGQDYDLKGKHTYGRVGPWHWDKRDNNAHYPKVPIPDPPPGTPSPTVELVRHINEVGANIPLWQAYMPL